MQKCGLATARRLTSCAFVNHSLRDQFLRGAKGVEAEERARVFRLGWDFVGTALASRNELYERFYLASGARNYQLAHALSLKDRANRLVDGILGKEPTGNEATKDEKRRKIGLAL